MVDIFASLLMYEGKVVMWLISSSFDARAHNKREEGRVCNSKFVKPA